MEVYWTFSAADKGPVQVSGCFAGVNSVIHCDTCRKNDRSCKFAECPIFLAPGQTDRRYRAF